MTKVRVLVSVAGTGFTWHPGEIVEMPEEQAAKWCDGERAERVEQARGQRSRKEALEKAVTGPPENRAARSGS